MSLRRIKHTLLRLTAEEKVIGIGALAMIIGTFMPWYSVVMNFDNKTLTETGFSGDLGVIGFVVFLMSLISLIVLVGETMRLPLPQFGYKREQILFFFLGQAFFLTLLNMAIYTKRSLQFTDAGLRFGAYLVLLGAFFGALSAFALMQKKKRKEVREFFSHEQEDENAVVEKNGEEAVTIQEVEEEMIQTKPEPMYFTEDMKAIEAVEEKPPQASSDQSGYFKREAGVDEK